MGKKKKIVARPADDKRLAILRERERAYLEAAFVGEMIQEGGMGFTKNPPVGTISAGAPYQPPRVKRES